MLTRKIQRALEKNGAMAVKIHGGPYQPTGLPDIVACVNGCFVGLEVKLPGREKTVTPRQALILKRIEKHGGVAAVVTSVDQALEAVWPTVKNL